MTDLSPPPEPKAVSLAAMLREGGDNGEAQSAIKAFNEAASPLQVPPVSPASQRWMPADLARERGLECYRVNGGTAAALRFRLPAIIELSVPGSQGKRYLAVTADEDGKPRIAPPIGGVERIATAEVAAMSTGTAFILWKNYLEIPLNLKSGSRGESVKRLQGLLKGAGTYAVRLTGTYDRATVAAVRRFQQLHGVEETGAIGPQTLMLLYRSTAAADRRIQREVHE